MTAVDPVARPQPPATVGARPERPLTAVCPYLAALDGSWRSSTVAREHRCGAVAPPAPLAAEKQRRLCLTVDHRTCSTYEAARAARPIAHDRVPPLPRPLARTTPVILDHGRLAISMPALRSDRSVWQALLIALLAIAFAAVVLARVTDGGISGGAAGASPSANVPASATAGSSASTPSGSPSTGGPSASAAATRGSDTSATPSNAAATAASSQTYKVKAGDTLVGIAAKFGTTPKAIAALNGLADLSSLKIGQVLKIP